jgi:hypothetical protein
VKSCEPPIGNISFGKHEDIALTERMHALFTADQAARQAEPIDWARLSAEDERWRIEVLRYLTHGQLCHGQSLFYAAFIFQHGDCPDHYWLAHQLAAGALEGGYEQARWIFAATLDRYLLSTGQAQKYGTQYCMHENGECELQPYDPATTDAEHQQYNVPILAEQLRHLQRREG